MLKCYQNTNTLLLQWNPKKCLHCDRKIYAMMLRNHKLLLKLMDCESQHWPTDSQGSEFTGQTGGASQGSSLAGAAGAGPNISTRSIMADCERKSTVSRSEAQQIIQVLSVSLTSEGRGSRSPLLSSRASPPESSPWRLRCSFRRQNKLSTRRWSPCCSLVQGLIRMKRAGG